MFIEADALVTKAPEGRHKSFSRPEERYVYRGTIPPISALQRSAMSNPYTEAHVMPIK